MRFGLGSIAEWGQKEQCALQAEIVSI